MTERQRPFLPTKQEATQGVSVYLSIPFCPTRCAYCSFPSFCLPKAPLQETYLTNLLSECQVIGAWLEAHDISVQTLYIGGGTPTSLSAFQLERLLKGVQLHFHTASLAEFTVEAGRPDTITSEKLQLLHDFGVGRISINPQSFSQQTLERIGRRHTVQEIFDVYALAREVGFDSINMDLITGRTGRGFLPQSAANCQTAAGKFDGAYLSSKTDSGLTDNGAGIAKHSGAGDGTAVAAVAERAGVCALLFVSAKAHDR